MYFDLSAHPCKGCDVRICPKDCEDFLKNYNRTVLDYNIEIQKEFSKSKNDKK